MQPFGSVKVIEFEDIYPADGLLRQRALYTYDMYKRMDPAFVLYETSHLWPGDKIGRFILSTTLLSRILHEPAPESLRQVLAALPSMLNAEGYLGWVMAPDRADETGLANMMWSNGLTEYYLWTKDEAALKWNRNLFEQVLLPAREAYHYYPPESPEKKDGKITWTHMSPGGETAGAYSIIDPATRGYALFPSPELEAEINELIRLFQKIDLLGIKAHVHATLFITRGILRWYELQGNPEHLAFAENLYRTYKQSAMTENYENYNWFGRPEWTEGCAIIDSLTVTLKLWQLTGKAEYLEDAHLILFNALLANQKDGDFGTNVCVGPNQQAFLKDGFYARATWCCSVHAGKGFARTLQYSQFLKDDGLVITILGNNMVTARLPGGELTLKQTTGYPYEGGVQFEVLSSASPQERELCVFLPSWVVPDSVAVSVNGQKVEAAIVDAFLRVKRVMRAGDVIRVAFEQAFRCAPLLNPEHMPGYHRYMYGPLLLGVDAHGGWAGLGYNTEEQPLPVPTQFEALGAACYRAKPHSATLVPLCDLMNLNDQAKRAKSGSAQVLFKD
jgi:uncharacterized protein